MDAPDRSSRNGGLSSTCVAGRAHRTPEWLTCPADSTHGILEPKWLEPGWLRTPPCGGAGGER
eukprot:5545811-Pyramimonas_sp.AAC.1